MEKNKRKTLKAAGFRIGDTEEFLELSAEEARLVELRLTVGKAMRRLRQKKHLTQQQLATKLKSSQSRVAKMESAAPDVSLDLLLRGLFLVGGDVAVSDG